MKIKIRKFKLRNGIVVETKDYESGRFKIFNSYGVPYSNVEGWEKGEPITLVTLNKGAEGSVFGEDYNIMEELFDEETIEE